MYQLQKCIQFSYRLSYLTWLKMGRAWNDLIVHGWRELNLHHLGILSFLLRDSLYYQSKHQYRCSYEFLFHQGNEAWSRSVHTIWDQVFLWVFPTSVVSHPVLLSSQRRPPSELTFGLAGQLERLGGPAGRLGIGIPCGHYPFPPLLIDEDVDEETTVATAYIHIRQRALSIPRMYKVTYCMASQHCSLLGRMQAQHGKRCEEV